jgi:hypothetical protein
MASVILPRLIFVFTLCQVAEIELLGKSGSAGGGSGNAQLGVGDGLGRGLGVFAKEAAT